MLISIVMPSFNQADFIEAAIRSVFNQKIQSLELIIMDGSSTDHTLVILKKLKKEFTDQLFWTSAPDSGPAEAINKALKKSKGQIIGWLNSDDLYSSHAINNALDAFKKNPQWVFLYGEGQHINEKAEFINQYPTKNPKNRLKAFQLGCYLCQPTVFFKRALLKEVGFLNQKLKVAFDFDYWLRIFKAYPKKIGYINKMQAYSRLHPACITQNQRQNVALEAMQVLFHQLGDVKIHWLLNYFEEIYQDYPFITQIKALQPHFIETIEKAAPFLQETDLIKLFEQLHKDKRWQITLPHVFIDIYPDGWAKPTLNIKIQHSNKNQSDLILYCEHTAPPKTPLTLDIAMSWQLNKQQIIYKKGGFYIFLKLPPFSKQQNLTVTIKTTPYFIVNTTDKKSLDQRQLTFIVNKMTQID